MEIVVEGVKPYDGRYKLAFAHELTTREWGWIKRLSGYLPLTLDDAVAGGDPEFACVLAAIAMRRSGKIDARDVPDVFDRLIDAPFGAAVTLDLEQADEEEDDASPPPPSSNGSEKSSGPSGRTSSETLPPTQDSSGTPDSDTSESDQQTLVS